MSNCTSGVTRKGDEILLILSEALGAECVPMTTLMHIRDDIINAFSSTIPIYPFPQDAPDCEHPGCCGEFSPEGCCEDEYRSLTPMEAIVETLATLIENMPPDERSITIENLEFKIGKITIS